MNKFFSFGFYEHLARRRVILALGLEKRSGRPEQWSKIPQKSDLIRRFGRFWGIWTNLEKFGFQFGLIVSAYKHWYD